ncbi:MAG: ComF family protein [Chitinophagaceae bacterium]|nr:MAG: ComF family protein [Chitinophagaceae bacterium]
MNAIFSSIKEFSTDFSKLFFPVNCAACSKVLQKNEEEICLHCISGLPKTSFWQFKDNPFEQLFWGRVDIHRAVALFYYKKGTKVQQLIHNIKYRGKLSAGEYCGKWLGEKLLEDRYFNMPDYVVPVPLHPKRKKVRGYNQADCIARGISKILKVPLETQNFKRVKYNVSQTKKSRFERWDNVDRIFEIENFDQFTGKHLLIVDDVVTTGSTLEACLLNLQKIENVTLSIVVLGFSSS